jgi:hypothetical protein
MVANFIKLVGSPSSTSVKPPTPISSITQDPFLRATGGLRPDLQILEIGVPTLLNGPSPGSVADSFAEIADDNKELLRGDQLEFNRPGRGAGTVSFPDLNLTEIILISDFEPLWEKQGGEFFLTEQGKYFYSMSLMRKLKAALFSFQIEKSFESNPELITSAKRAFSQNINLISRLDDIYDNFHLLLRRKNDFIKWFNATHPENSFSFREEMSKLFFDEDQFSEEVLDLNFSNDDAVNISKNISYFSGIPEDSNDIPENTKKIIKLLIIFRSLLSGKLSSDLKITNELFFIGPIQFNDNFNPDSIETFVSWSIKNNNLKELIDSFVSIKFSNFRTLEINIPIFCRFISQEISASPRLLTERFENSLIDQLVFFNSFPNISQHSLDDIYNSRSFFAQSLIGGEIGGKVIFNFETERPSDIRVGQDDSPFDGFSKFFSDPFNVDENEDFLNFQKKLKENVSLLRDIKRAGLVPFNYSEVGDSLTSSSGLYRSLFSKFFNDQGSSKFEIGELSSLLVFSSFRPKEGVFTPSFLQDLIFKLIISNAFDIDRGTDFFTVRRKELFDIIIQNEDGQILASKQIDDDENKIGFKEDDFFRSFSKVDSFEEIDPKFPPKCPEGLNLFSIISKTIIDFYFFFKRRCCIPGTERCQKSGVQLLVILRALFDVIFQILKECGHGKFPYAYNERNKILHFKTGQQDQNKVKNHYSGSFDPLFSFDEKFRRVFCSLTNFFQKNLEKISEMNRLSSEIDSFYDIFSHIYESGTFSLNDVSASKRAIRELKSVFTSENFNESGLPNLNFLSSTVVGEKMQNAFDVIFKNDPLFSDKTKKQKIISVGLPSGFYERALQDEKFSGLVNLKIFKIDVLNPQWVFKPKVFRFDLNKFPLKIDDLFEVKTNFREQLESFPLLDLNSKKFAETIGDSKKETPEERDRTLYSLNPVFINQARSFLLEIYCKILSGFSLSEGDVFLQKDFSEQISQILSLFSLSNQDFSSGSPLNPFSSSKDVLKYVILPKKFDRIFNVVVDSSDFDIDSVNSPNDGSTYRPESNLSFDCFIAQFESIVDQP